MRDGHAPRGSNTGVALVVKAVHYNSIEVVGMCGIAGWIQPSHRAVSVAKFRASVDQVKHRGPNDEGYCFWGDVKDVESSFKSHFFSRGPQPYNVAFGHRRLSILDLSERGHQPMDHSDLWVVHNGEVYNFKELRSELEQLGCEFRSGTDTEVILAAYRQWGAAAFQKFNGMWAFALWDIRNSKLVLSRDRFGVKPLYFSKGAERGFAFASEIKQLRHLGFGSGRVDYDLAARFLSEGKSDDTRETLFEGIHRLLPGEFLEWDLSRGNHPFKIKKYYEISRQTSADTFSEWSKGFRDLLEDSVRLRLRADVRTGSCLSGGLDSSTLVGLVQKLEPQVEQFTFTSSFSNPLYDELSFARQVSGKFNTKEHIVRPDLDQLWKEDLNRVLWHQDEPFLSTSIYAQWKVMESAGQNNVKVLLDGQGGDEVLGGYHRYVPLHLAGLLTSGRFGTLKNQICSMKQSGLLALIDSPFRLIASTILKSLGVYEWQGREYRDLLLRSYESPSRPRGNLFEQLKFDLLHSMQPLLRYEDRNSMAHSIEARTPFLDYRLVEWVMGGRPEWLYEEGVTKSPLRKAARELLPPGVANRMDKMGFVTPEIEWNQAHAELLRAEILKPGLKLWHWLDRDEVIKLVNRRSFKGLGFVPWRWLVFERWMNNQRLLI